MLTDKSDITRFLVQAVTLKFSKIIDTPPNEIKWTMKQYEKLATEITNASNESSPEGSKLANYLIAAPFVRRLIKGEWVLNEHGRKENNLKAVLRFLGYSDLETFIEEQLAKGEDVNEKNKKLRLSIRSSIYAWERLPITKSGKWWSEYELPEVDLRKFVDISKGQVLWPFMELMADIEQHYAITVRTGETSVVIKSMDKVASYDNEFEACVVLRIKYKLFFKSLKDSMLAGWNDLDIVHIIRGHKYSGYWSFYEIDRPVMFMLHSYRFYRINAMRICAKYEIAREADKCKILIDLTAIVYEHFFNVNWLEADELCEQFANTYGNHRLQKIIIAQQKGLA